MARQTHSNGHRMERSRSQRDPMAYEVKTRPDEQATAHLRRGHAGDVQ